MRYGLYLAGIVPIALFAGNPAMADVDICSCVNEPIDTDEKARACGALMDAMTPQESVRATGECKAQQARRSGLDLCTCLMTLQTDPEIVKQCEAIIGKDTTPSEMSRLAANCR